MMAGMELVLLFVGLGALAVGVGSASVSWLWSSWFRSYLLWVGRPVAYLMGWRPRVSLFCRACNARGSVGCRRDRWRAWFLVIPLADGVAVMCVPCDNLVGVGCDGCGSRSDLVAVGGSRD